jgi:hypothetical protein
MGKRFSDTGLQIAPTARLTEGAICLNKLVRNRTIPELTNEPAKRIGPEHQRWPCRTLGVTRRRATGNVRDLDALAVAAAP